MWEKATSYDPKENFFSSLSCGKLKKLLIEKNSTGGRDLRKGGSGFMVVFE